MGVNVSSRFEVKRYSAQISWGAASQMLGPDFMGLLVNPALQNPMKSQAQHSQSGYVFLQSNRKGKTTLSSWS